MSKDDIMDKYEGNYKILKQFKITGTTAQKGDVLGTTVLGKGDKVLMTIPDPDAPGTATHMGKRVSMDNLQTLIDKKFIAKESTMGSKAKESTMGSKLDRLLSGEDARFIMEEDSHEVAVKKILKADKVLGPRLKKLGIKFKKREILDDPTAMPEIMYGFSGKHEPNRIEDVGMELAKGLGFKYVRGIPKGMGYFLQLTRVGSKTNFTLIYMS